MPPKSYDLRAFQLPHPFFGMRCQIDLETIQSFLYPLLNLKHIVTCIFSITDFFLIILL